MNLIEVHKEPLKAFCIDNGYNFEKLKSMPRCGNESVMFIQTYDSKKAGNGLNNNTPAEILLSLNVDEYGITKIQKGKNADKYLKQ